MSEKGSWEQTVCIFFKAAEKSKGFSVLYVIIGGIQMSLFMIVAEDGG